MRLMALSRTIRTTVVCAIIGVTLLAAALHATVSIPTDLPDVVASATLIVRGRVVDTRAFTEIANGPVVTAVTVSVTETLKGAPDRAVTFRVHGGELGRYRQMVIGAPTFAAGDDAYLFLKRAPDGLLWTVGMGAGVYKISSVSGPLVVNPPLVAGVTATAGAQVARGDSRRKPMGIGDFSGVVKLLMAAGTGGSGVIGGAGGLGPGVVIK